MTAVTAQAIIDAAARTAPRSDRGPTPRKLDFVLADQLPDGDETFDDELIEGTIGRIAMAVLYGDSNSGKTFLAIDIGAAVAQGIEWLGKSVDGGMVVYLATESPTSVQMRLRAYQRHHRVRVPGFVIVKSPINLFDGLADTEAVIDLVRDLEREHGAKVALIVGDTLARLAVGANENAGEDMGVVVRNIDAIRAATGAAFVLVHHTGKDAAKGMRGWSGLRAATDTEIEVTADDATGLRSAEITKQRDLPGKGERIGFRLQPVHIGVNRWGNPRGSCVVEASDAPTPRPRGKRVSEIAGAVVELLTQHGAGMLKGRIVAHFDGRYNHSGVYRELKAMVEDGRLIESVGVLALPGKPVLIRGAE